MTMTTDHDLMRHAHRMRQAACDARDALTRAMRGLNNEDAAALIEPLRDALDARARALNGVCDALATGRAGREDDVISALEARGYVVQRVTCERARCVLCGDDAAPITVWEFARDANTTRVWVRACQQCGLARM